jgi:tyrosyl-tRNA synthetase
MWRYYELLTNLTVDQITALRLAAESGERNPRDIKAELAKSIIADFYSQEAAILAEEEFTRIFRRKEAPERLEESAVDSGNWELKQLLVELGLASSKGEARRLIEQGGVTVDGERCDPKINKYYILRPDRPGYDIKVGKRRFVRVRGK